jgi:hypothetical protein
MPHGKVRYDHLQSLLVGPRFHAAILDRNTAPLIKQASGTSAL